MNILIYTGPGTSIASNRHTLLCLRAIFSPHYAVTTITDKQLLEEPWPSHTSMLVMPGGADLPFCERLNGRGTALIRQYVRNGGRYLGICAGAYFGAAFCEFEPNTPLEVIGPRQLAFYKGTARGTVFKGFNYNTDSGVRAALLSSPTGDAFRAYYNGGCLFDDGDPDAEILSQYMDPIECECTRGKPAAVVYKRVGRGHVVLTGAHIEYITASQSDECSKSISDALNADVDKLRIFLAYVFDKMELLQPANLQIKIPTTTPLILVQRIRDAEDPIGQIIDQLSSYLATDTLVDTKNTFVFRDAGDILAKQDVNDEYIDIRVMRKENPLHRETPFFNIGYYFERLGQEQSNLKTNYDFGSTLLYGEVVTSTSTLLEKNQKFLRAMPHGFVFVATQQLNGRGRGDNAWISPVGLLAFSGVLRVPLQAVRDSLVFVQYLIAISVIEAIHSYGTDFQNLGVKLKWPNDIYLQRENKDFCKIGGIIVSCNASKDEFILVYGVGINVDNKTPTTCLNHEIDAYNREHKTVLPRIKHEDLLARTLPRINANFLIFVQQGFGPFEHKYYKFWMHNNTVVHLDRYGVNAKIEGIAPQTGMLLAYEIDSKGKCIDRKYELQPDGNSFDMLKGLIKAKTSGNVK